MIREVMIMDREALKKNLADHGLKVSRQRLQILDFLVHTESHPTADEIFRKLNQDNPVLSRATVYNTLNTFVETGVIHALDLRDSETRYDASLHDHGHFRCKVCQKLFNFEISEDLLKHELPGYRIEEHHVTLRGVCPACLKKEKK